MAIGRFPYSWQDQQRYKQAKIDAVARIMATGKVPHDVELYGDEYILREYSHLDPGPARVKHEIFPGESHCYNCGSSVDMMHMIGCVPAVVPVVLDEE